MAWRSCSRERQTCRSGLLFSSSDQNDSMASSSRLNDLPTTEPPLVGPLGAKRLLGVGKRVRRHQRRPVLPLTRCTQHPEPSRGPSGVLVMRPFAFELGLGQSRTHGAAGAATFGSTLTRRRTVCLPANERVISLHRRAVVGLILGWRESLYPIRGRALGLRELPDGRA